ncbi:FmdB family zinc ribbon protein [Thiolapillus sp.]
MPFYEYRCKACDHELEAMQKMSDAPLKNCPECGKPELQKLISATGFRLKGGGWYETDFKSGQKKNVADSGKDKSSSGGGGCGGGSCGCH